MNRKLFRGKLVRLAASRPEDYEIMASWWDDSEFQRLSNPAPAMPRSADELRKREESREQQNDFSWRVRTITDDHLIGSISLFHIEWNNGTATLGVAIGVRELWGKGYGTEAIELVLNYAFNELNLHRVGLGTVSFNTRAIRAYEKLGFQHEGVARETLLRDGVRHDGIMMGILRQEWVSGQASAKTPRKRRQR